jgi:hypothetical protein
VSTVKKSHAIHALSLPADELAPEDPAALAGRPDPCSHRDVADARLGDLDAEPDQLTGGPPVSPSRVLASEPRDQLANLTGDPRAPGTPSRIGPAASHEPAVPRQQRSRGHEEQTPAPTREQPARRRQERAVRGPQCRAGNLSAQDRDLVAQDDDLQLLELRRAKTQQHERHQTPQQHVQQRRQHQPLP